MKSAESCWAKPLTVEKTMKEEVVVEMVAREGVNSGGGDKNGGGAEAKPTTDSIS